MKVYNIYVLQESGSQILIESILQSDIEIADLESYVTTLPLEQTYIVELSDGGTSQVLFNEQGWV